MIARLFLRALGVALDVADALLDTIERERPAPRRVPGPSAAVEEPEPGDAIAEQEESSIDETVPAAPVTPTRICRGCGGPFHPENGRVRYCGDHCRKKLAATKQRAARRAAAEAGAIGSGEAPGAPAGAPGAGVVPAEAPSPAAVPPTVERGAVPNGQASNGAARPVCQFCFAPIAEGEVCGEKCRAGLHKIIPPAQLPSLGVSTKESAPQRHSPRWT